MLTLVETCGPGSTGGSGAGCAGSGCGAGYAGIMIVIGFDCVTVLWLQCFLPQPPLMVSRASEAIDSRVLGWVVGMTRRRAAHMPRSFARLAAGLAPGARPARVSRGMQRGEPCAILAGMKHALLALVAAAATSSAGCVTAAGIARPNQVKLPLFIGAVAADLVVISAAGSQIQDYTFGGSLATALAITAVDVVAGCLVGACSSLRL